MTKLIALALAVSVTACAQPQGNGSIIRTSSAQSYNEMLTSLPALGPQSKPYVPSDNVSGFPVDRGRQGQSADAIIDTGTSTPRASDSGWTY